MDTLTPAAAACRHATLQLASRHATEFLDLTHRLEALVAESRIRTGIVNVQTRHTTTGVVVNEHEPLLLEDFASFLDRAAPRSALYRHDDMVRRSPVPFDEPANGHAHCRALLLPTSTILNIVDGQLALGRWQRVFLVELDGPRRRDVSVVLLGEAAL